MPLQTHYFSRNLGDLKRLGLVFFFLLGGVGLSLFLYFKTLKSEEQKVEQRFIRLAEHHRHLLATTISNKLNAIRSMQILFSHSQEVTRKEFEGACMLLTHEDKDFSALEWIPVISHSERDNLEKRARKYGYRDFSIREISPSNGLIPARDADTYYPIFFVYPYDQNRKVLGLNLKNLSSRQELKVAVQTGKPVCSHKMALIQSLERQDGWILTIPVYDADADAEDPVNHAHLSKPRTPIGFVQAVLYLDDLFTEAWKTTQLDYLQISVDEVTADYPEPHTHSLWNNFDQNQLPPPPDDRAYQIQLPVMQQTWLLTFHATEDMLLANRFNLPLTILVAGCIISFLIALFVYHLLALNHKVEQQVRERVYDLKLANEQLSEEMEEHQKSEAARQELEKRLGHAQKMEAIGTLAGGIAHDFNNILTAIMGYIDLLKEEVQGNPHGEEIAGKLQKSSMRARDLVRRILTFSRHKEQEFQIILPAPVIMEAIHLMRSTIPATINIQTHVDQPLPNIEADPSQIHQIVLNLLTNSWHAIGQNNGQINVYLSGKITKESLNGIDGPIPPAHYVCLCVEDNGTGMSEETIKRIFEPYFTTKKTGQGSGMGLSVVHGIVLNHNGHILIQSTPGVGTRFQLYFPAHHLPAQIPKPEAPRPLRGEQQRIVIVDDEKIITSLIKTNLIKNGFLVEAFTESPECLEYLQRTRDQISLLIMDSSMPEINGIHLLTTLRKQHPDLPVIVYSGRITEEDTQAFRKAGVDALLYKPLSFSELNLHISKILHPE